MTRDECVCNQEVVRLNEDWESTEVWLYSFNREGAAVIQVRDSANQLLTTIEVNFCPLCGRYLK